MPLLLRVYGTDSVWFDDQIHGGADWWKLILQQVADCEVFIYLVSNDSLESRYCRSEFREALRLQKQILPVIARPKTQYPKRAPADLRGILRRTQYVDLSKGFKDATAISQLYASVNDLLAQVMRSGPLPPLRADPIEAPVVSEESPSNTRFELSAPQATIIAAVITGILGVIIALITLSAGGDSPPKSPESNGSEQHPTAITTPDIVAFMQTQDTQTAAGSATLIVQTPPVTRPAASDGTHLTIQRSGDAVAVCVDKPTSLSSLRLDFGHSTRYTLGDWFVESAQTQAGQCWCMQLEDPVFSPPKVCQDENTNQQSVAASTRDFWRNGTLTLTLNQTPIGTCEAQPSNLEIYQCEFVLMEE